MMGFFTQAKTQTYQPTHNRGYLFPAHDRRHSSGTSACDIDHTIKILPRPPFGSVAFLFRFARGPKRPNSAHLLNPKNKNKHAEPRKREPYISGIFLLSRRSEGTPPPLPTLSPSPRVSQCPRPRTDRRACRDSRRSERRRVRSRRTCHAARGRTSRRGSSPVRAWVGCKRLRNARGREGSEGGKHNI
jgi:hypothetical protein